MAQKQIVLPRETALLMHIAILQRENADLHTRLLQQQTEHQHVVTMLGLLDEAGIRLPVPLTQCAFDVAQGALTYDDAGSASLPLAES